MEKVQVIKNNKNSYFVSILFLTFVIILTIGLFVYNNNLVVKQEKLKESIKNRVETLEYYKSNDKFKIYSLIQSNKKNLEKLELNSKITKFLEHMNYIRQTYGIDFRGFNLNSSIIGTSVIINSDEYSNINYDLAYQKFSKFIGNYREDEKALFNLAFINKISGHDQMKFNLNFIIK